MIGNKVTMSQLRKNLGKFVNRAAYGNERIVLLSRGETIAALIGIKDLQNLESLRTGRTKDRSYQKSFKKALESADEIRERISKWQRKHGIQTEDSVLTLEKLRQGRDEELSGVR